MIQGSNSSRRSDKKRPSRSGAVLIAVLACMMITVVLVGGAMKSTMAARRQCKSELQMQQAELLLQAGVDRVAAIVQSDSATTAPALWNAQSAMPAYEIATVEYQIVEPTELHGRGLQCTVKLALSNQAKELIQLSRMIPFNTTTASNQSQTNPESR